MAKPGFCIIGAQKSASSFLQNLVAQHNDIYMPNGETPIFESPDYEQPDFFNKLEKLGSHNLVSGFKRPNYLCNEAVPSRFKRNLPSCKFIAVLRNPAERVFSAYFHNMADGFIPLKDPVVGIKDIFEGRVDFSIYPKAKEIIDFSMYGFYLRKWFEVYSIENFLLIKHDDVVSNVNESIHKVYRFLGVDPSFYPDTKSRPQAVQYDLGRLEFIRMKNRVRYSYNEDLTRLYPRSLTKSDEVFLEKLNKIESIYLSSKKVKKEMMSEDLKGYLLDFYKKDISLTEELTGLDLRLWYS